MFASMKRKFLFLLLQGMFFSLAFAQSDVGIVNRIAGDVTYTTASDNTPRKIQPYARIRHGDKLAVASGGEVQIRYFSTNRQEAWKGGASFVATSAGGELLKGSKPEVTEIPAIVSQKLARVPELMNTSRIGGVVVRSLSAQKDRAQRYREVADAMSAYEVLRAKSAEDDVTPELFLMTALIDNEMYADLKSVIQEMQKRQPNNPEFRQLASWALEQERK